jgi:predicted Zn-dependent protease
VAGFRDHKLNSRNHRRLFRFGLAFSLTLIAIATLVWSTPSWSQDQGGRSLSFSDPAALERSLPTPQAHPLPTSLAAWRDPEQQGDYFAQIQPTEVGYLVWSEWPVQVYIEPASDGIAPWQHQQSQTWVEAVTQAVADWQPYVPLVITNQPEAAQISIWRRTPALQHQGNQDFRSRSAETRYTLYIQRQDSSAAKLTHRCSVTIRPSQTSDYIQAAARHELGHALGIWGHSSKETDALYYAQVRHPAAISVRDINTLQRVYQQPTRLGWPLPQAILPNQ